MAVEQRVDLVSKTASQDTAKMLICETQIGSKNIEHGMKRYVYKRSTAGHHLIDIQQTWQKLMVAARIIAAVPNAGDVCAVASRQYASRSVLKYAHYTGAQAVAGRWTPGQFTNQITQKFSEPRVAIISDPLSDAQAIKECAMSNIMVIAFCNTDAPIEYVDWIIPCNNRTPNSIGLMYWLLAREVLYLRGTLKRKEEWDLMPDMFFYRDAFEPEKEAAGDGEGQEAATGPGEGEVAGANWNDAGPATGWTADNA